MLKLLAALTICQGSPREPLAWRAEKEELVSVVRPLVSAPIPSFASPRHGAVAFRPTRTILSCSRTAAIQHHRDQMCDPITRTACAYHDAAAPLAPSRRVRPMSERIAALDLLWLQRARIRRSPVPQHRCSSTTTSAYGMGSRVRDGRAAASKRLWSTRACVLSTRSVSPPCS